MGHFNWDAVPFFFCFENVNQFVLSSSYAGLLLHGRGELCFRYSGVEGEVRKKGDGRGNYCGHESVDLHHFYTWKLT
jgi:hypothetical protein